MEKNIRDGAAEQLLPGQIRLVQSLADLQMACSAVEFMCELGDDHLVTRVERRRYRCFEDTAVIAYGRAFTKANNLPSLSLKQIKIRPNSNERALHERLLERRHKVIAHSDADRQRISFTTECFSWENKQVKMPRFDFDDALAFFAERQALVAWLSTLISATSKRLFEQVQSMPEIRFVRDHTLTVRSNAGEG
ncbi:MULTISPECIES: hypothetical protein [unclassified Gluconobacter]|uniref:hypothetical protein n=1 Tax=unclassified Gluconobacter TaxID=2644261 RepID=UPI00029AE3A5|nr:MULTISPECIES: hypothetical protein [unclassified Gluconobacter]GAP25481.1 hypothetical protein GLF_2363 [Gluconobacter frateurii NBRC 101659]